MKEYKINEIFYSLQGEGRWAGRAAIFIRFSGCNLKCPFCDTNFEAKTIMSEESILQLLATYKPCDFVVLTGGEPTLQVTREFIDALHSAGYYVAMETNGTRPVEELGVDWVTCSPKVAYQKQGTPRLAHADEVKVVYDGLKEHQPDDCGIPSDNYYVQPCDVGDPVRNANIIEACVQWVKQHPIWKLSLQQQKILNVR